jgi:capsular exopolysaccharide synthesis family protein
MVYNRAEARRDSDPDSGVVPYRRQAALQLVADEQEAESRIEDRAAQFWAIFRTLLRRRWLILGVLVVGLSGAAALTLTKTPLYRSSATLEVQRQETKIIKSDDVQPDTIADAEHMATQYALLKSRALAERVAEVLDLPGDPRFARQADARQARLEAATETVIKGLEVLPVSRSRVIEVRYHGPYPAETARIVNAIAENFIQMNLERRYNDTSYARNFLEERLQTTKAALEDAERKLITYSREEEIIDLSSVGGSAIGSSLDASSLMALNGSLTKATDERLAAEQRYNASRNNPNAREILDSETIKSLNARRSELAGEYEQKLGKYKADWPELKELSARIASLDGDLEAERMKIMASIDADYRTAVERENALQERVNVLKTQVQDLRGRSVDYNILNREVDTLRGQYDALLQRFKEVSIASGIGSSQVSIVDRGEVPKRAYDPDLRSELLRAFVLSLACAIGLALLLEYIDDTIKTPDDIKAKLGLPVMGVVPRIRGRATVSEQLKDPRSAVSEAFSSARTALQFATPAGAPRTLLITGVRPSEGKTSTVLALAIAFAASGKRVLIIDADMRRPSFAAPAGSSVGLSGFLTQDVALLEQILPGSVPNVFLLPAGVLPPNPAELLANQRLALLISQAAEHFDHVLVDSPPVLDFADAPTLSAACEATMLVLQAGAIRRPVARRTIERLTEAQGSVIGAILTKFDIRRSEHAYGYNYAYAYGYGYGKKAIAAEARKRRRIELFSADDMFDSGKPQA